MSFKEVKELRKQGNLEKAFEIAKQDLEIKKDDLWNKRSIAWVYYDYLKRYADQKNYLEFCKYLDLINELILPEGEYMVFDQIAWQVGKIVNSLNFADILPEDKEKVTKDNGNVSLVSLTRILEGYRIDIFNKIRNYHFSKPSESYTFLFKMYMKNLCIDNEPFFLEFADWWSFENFLPADYQKRVTEDGKPYMSLAEQAYINYSKQLLKKIPDENGLNFKLDTDRIEGFFPKLDKMISQHLDWEYPLYFKAKLFFALEKKDEIREFILPFAKKKRNEFWVWDLLSDTYPDEDDHKLACLCKALLCEAQEKMTVNVHVKLAKILKTKGFKVEAETEEAIIKSIKGEIVTGEFIPLKSAADLKNNNGKENKEFYQEYQSLAEEILFSNTPAELAIVEFVNKDKKILNFIVNKTKAGFFKYDRYLKKVEIGERLMVRLKGSGINEPYKVFTLKKTDLPVSNEIMKEFNGKLRKNENQPFGFVDDIFIEPRLIQKHKLANGNELSGTAIISFNKKKSSWGWKAIKLV